MRESITTFAIGMILGAAACLSQWPDTPAPVSEIIIDTATGCHYVQGQAGGITPRLAPPPVDDPRVATGWHICSGPEGGDDAAWEDGGEPDPEAESTYSTQPTDLWRNHTTE